MNKNLTLLPLTAAILFGSALAAGSQTASQTTTQSQATQAQTPANTSHPQRGERPQLTEAQHAERQAQMKTQLQARISELLAQSGSNAQAAQWLQQAQTLLNSTDVTQQQAALGLVRSAQSVLGVEPQHGKGHGPRGMDGRGERGERPQLTEAQHAERQAQMKTQLQARISELLAQSGSNAQAAQWLQQAQTLLNSTDASAHHTAMSLVRAAESALGVEPQDPQHGAGHRTQAAPQPMTPTSGQ
ncbi:hypothetical protein [Deinococcus sp. SL84]|uniref:hypothetical protein n=1 Tax=Deinococcus sp. SL84 TaxID=2994663 RepID=UPI0022726067|nr:hypothetical protein [Deinococcus sp. SL84]MCY1704253.1 hypothetical protein [Deinococcus sp. SL84]